MNEEKRMNLIQLAALLLLEMNSDIEIEQANETPGQVPVS